MHSTAGRIRTVGSYCSYILATTHVLQHKKSLVHEDMEDKTRSRSSTCGTNQSSDGSRISRNDNPVTQLMLHKLRALSRHLNHYDPWKNSELQTVHRTPSAAAAPFSTAASNVPTVNVCMAKILTLAAGMSLSTKANAAFMLMWPTPPIPPRCRMTKLTLCDGLAGCAGEG